MHLELALVGRELLFRFLQLERELRRRRAIAGFQIRLRLGLELLHVRAAGRRLPRDALDEAAVLLQPGAPFLELLDGTVVLVPHLRHRIGLPEDVRDLVDLGDERGPELVKDHRCLLRSSSPEPHLDPTCDLLAGFPLGRRGLGKNLALVNTVERRA